MITKETFTLPIVLLKISKSVYNIPCKNGIFEITQAGGKSSPTSCRDDGAWSVLDLCIFVSEIVEVKGDEVVHLFASIVSRRLGIFSKFGVNNAVTIGLATGKEFPELK